MVPSNSSAPSPESLHRSASTSPLVTAERTVPSVITASTPDVIQIAMRNVTNLDGHYILKVRHQLEVPRLRHALSLSLAQAPVLLSSVEPHWYRPRYHCQASGSVADILEVVETDNVQQELNELMRGVTDTRVGPLIRVVLFRSASDTLCIKVNHSSGDAPSMLRFLQEVFASYERLRDNPDYAPSPAVPARSFAGLVREMSLKKKWSVIRKMKQSRAVKDCNWTISSDQVSDEGHYYVVRTLPVATAEGLSRKGRRLRATLPMILLACYYRALRQTLGSCTTAGSTIGTTADLRNYWKGCPESFGFGNLSGASRLFFRHEHCDSVANAIEELRDQYTTALREGLLGMTHPALVLSYPILRQIFRCIPFRMIDRKIASQVRAMQTSGERRTAFVYVGDVGIDGEGEIGANLEDAYLTPAVYRAGGFILVGSRCAGKITLALGARGSVISQDTAAALVDRVVSEAEGFAADKAAPPVSD